MGENSSTLIKVCGITREADAVNALKAGADAIGLNFFDGSQRFVSPGKAVNITRIVKDRALKVGLFVDAAPDFVKEVLKTVPLDILQFHGDETPTYCGQFKLPYWKALRVRDVTEISRLIASHETASAVVLDAWHPTQYGGTGKTFDWSLIDKVLENTTISQHLILAGGLTPENVAQAVRKVRPWGVDVSSGVEETPGIKSETLMINFIEEARSV